MSNRISRRQWLVAAPSATLVATRFGFADEPHPASTGGVHAEFPSHDPARVYDVVLASHANIDRVRELVEASPTLAKSSWDWGFGDWESALGAASHTGRLEIANLLIKHGARPNLFTFAMMGKLDAVRSIVEAMPGIQRIPGPHGISLLSHAKHGHGRNKEKISAQVVEYLESLGDADPKPTSREITDDEKQVYLGRYVFGNGPDDTLQVLVNSRGQLAIKRGDRSSRVLNRVEENGFAPGGAPAVRVRFKIDNGRATSLTVHDPSPLITASRTG